MADDRCHTAVHEAGHAVIGRVLGMICGPVMILADDDSAGHAITHDPWAILAQWERQGRWHRTAKTCFRGRALTFMSGAEAEVALLGSCRGGDGDDRYQVEMMLASRLAEVDDVDRVEARLRKAAAALCRRHADKIGGLAEALLLRGHIDDDAEVRSIAGLPAPAGVVDPPWLDEPEGEAVSLSGLMHAKGSSS